MPPHNASERNLHVLERIELGFIPDDGLTFDEPIAVEWLHGEVLNQDPSGLTFTASQPGRVRVSVTPIGPVETRPPISVRGTIEVSAATSCVRCLAEVKVDVRADVDATLMFAAVLVDPADTPKEKKRKAKDLGDWEDDLVPVEALDEQTYGADGLDLGILIRESILLGFEMNPTCEDEGECDLRTAALLAEANKGFIEGEAAVDPRWAALAALRNKG